jgi:hypothetical protein
MNAKELAIAVILVLLFASIGGCTPYVGVGVGATVGPGGMHVGPNVGIGFHG